MAMGGRLMPSLSESIPSHARVEQIHGLIDRLHGIPNEACQRIHDSILAIKAVGTAECTDANGRRKEITV